MFSQRSPLTYDLRMPTRALLKSVLLWSLMSSVAMYYGTGLLVMLVARMSSSGGDPTIAIVLVATPAGLLGLIGGGVYGAFRHRRHARVNR